MNRLQKLANNFITWVSRWIIVRLKSGCGKIEHCRSRSSSRFDCSGCHRRNNSSFVFISKTVSGSGRRSSSCWHCCCLTYFGCRLLFSRAVYVISPITHFSHVIVSVFSRTLEFLGRSFTTLPVQIAELKIVVEAVLFRLAIKAEVRRCQNIEKTNLINYCDVVGICSGPQFFLVHAAVVIQRFV